MYLSFSQAPGLNTLIKTIYRLRKEGVNDTSYYLTGFIKKSS